MCGARVNISLITFWVVAWGSAQNARSSPSAGQSRPVERYELRQRVGRELGKHLAHLLPGLAVGREQRDLDLGMAKQESNTFRSGIAGSAEHADFRQLGHDPLRSSAENRIPRRANAREIRGRR